MLLLLIYFEIMATFGDYFTAPAAHPLGRYAWQNGCPAIWFPRRLGFS